MQLENMFMKDFPTFRLYNEAVAQSSSCRQLILQSIMGLSSMLLKIIYVITANPTWQIDSLMAVWLLRLWEFWDLKAWSRVTDGSEPLSSTCMVKLNLYLNPYFCLTSRNVKPKQLGQEVSVLQQCQAISHQHRGEPGPGEAAVSEAEVWRLGEPDNWPDNHEERWQDW